MPGDGGGFLKLERTARWEAEVLRHFSLVFFFFLSFIICFCLIFLRDLNIIKTNRCCRSVRLLLIIAVVNYYYYFIW